MKRMFTVLAIGILSLTGCGTEGSTASDDAPKKSASESSRPDSTPAKPKSPTPIGCLEDAGLDSPEQRDDTFWRGTVPGGAMLVRIDKMPSAAQAAQAVKDATDVQAAQAGSYAVFGGIKPADDGSFVRDVAACLSK